MNIVVIVSALIVGVSTVGAAFTYLRSARNRFARVALLVAATIATLLALGSIFVPFLAFFASIVAIIVALALFVALLGTRRNALPALAVVAVLAAFSLAVAQPLGLKVLNLPKADPLPYEPVPFHVVKTYDEGVWFESVRAGRDGTLYLAANMGLNFTRGDYFHGAHGEVIARRPDGTERVLFATPDNTLTGCFAIAGDDTIFMASNGERPAIWRISQDGRGQRFAPLPAGAWPNGLAFGPDGNLYSSDSSLGRIWRIDPKTGRATIAIKDSALSVRSFLSLAPGANGLQFRESDLIVTVSDRTTVLAYHLDSDGRFAAARVLARGIPGDDFAVGRDGSLFVTTHPYNTIVRVMPDGTRIIVGDARQHIVGATDAHFGTTSADRDTLYVATDGGAYTGGPKTRGELVALYPYAKQ